MISPTTTSSNGSSVTSCPWRLIAQVVVIIVSSFAVASLLRDSWTNRRMPEASTIIAIMPTVIGSKSSGSLPKREKYGKMISVIVITMARAVKITVNGFTKALTSRSGNVFFR